MSYSVGYFNAKLELELKNCKLFFHHKLNEDKQHN